jgi:2-methylisocitrate lyase-like PEP mutase family enzyme
MHSIQSRRAAFWALHESGCFAMPNPWDVGTARYLRHLGFKALATTSSGLSFSQGLPDMDWAVPLDVVLEHVAQIAAATELPVNVDFESGYADDPDGVARNVAACVALGAAGLSIEDATGEGDAPLYAPDLAVERIRAAKAVTGPAGVVLTARAECFLVGHPDPLPEAIRRLRAYAEAGADVLYAPGIRTREQIVAVVEAVAPKPVNVLVSADIGLTLDDLRALGVRRVSIGSGMARAAWGGFLRAARTLAAEGRFAGFDGAEPFADLNAFFREDLERRS